MTVTARRTFSVPTKEEVTAANQEVFIALQKKLGFVPNLYAYFAKNETALADYLAFQNRKSTLSGKEREIVNLVTSQLNGCRYCQSAHTALGKMHGFTEEQILELRHGSAAFNEKYDALARFVAEVVNNKGRVSQDTREAFFEAGYTEAHLIDVIIVVGDKIISNYLHNLTGFEIDFPLAEEI
jgi:uncharacterized peroxidase-related enzyme